MHICTINTQKIHNGTNVLHKYTIAKVGQRTSHSQRGEDRCWTKAWLPPCKTCSKGGRGGAGVVAVLDTPPLGFEKIF